MNLDHASVDITAGPPGKVAVFRGPRADAAEFSLVLDALGMGYERVDAEGSVLLLVERELATAAALELSRYAAERAPRREAPAVFVPFSGAAAAAAVYAGVLILVAYCAGRNMFGIDWLVAGALEPPHAQSTEWWRALTALTLHLDQEHLMGNLLFGVGIGTLAGRLFGPGSAWLGILAAGAAGNVIEMCVSPPWHRAVGASTAVFAALGLLAGFGWAQPRVPRERRLYRWAPLFGGVGLLLLLGAGDAHVDVLGHLLGFTTGTALGWLYCRLGLPQRRGRAAQTAAAALALVAIGSAWALAIAAA